MSVYYVLGRSELGQVNGVKTRLAAAVKHVSCRQTTLELHQDYRMWKFVHSI